MSDCCRQTPFLPVIFVIFLCVWFFSPVLAQDFTLKMGVSVNAEPAIVEDLERYLFLEFNALADVVVVKDAWEYEISVLGLETSNGITAAVLVTYLITPEMVKNSLMEYSLFGVHYTKRDSLRSELSMKYDSSRTRIVVDSYLLGAVEILNYRLFTGNSIPEVCARITEAVNNDVFEPRRVAWKRFMD